MLILGCGNPDRGDDAAGLLVARRLCELGVEARECSGLLDDWTESEEVIVIDAVVSGAAPGAITVWNARDVPLPTAPFRCSSHALGVAEAVELSRALGRLPPKLTVYGIEAASFDLLQPPSREVMQAVEQLAQTLASLLAQAQSSKHNRDLDDCIRVDGDAIARGGTELPGL